MRHMTDDEQTKQTNNPTHQEVAVVAAEAVLQSEGLEPRRHVVDRQVRLHCFGDWYVCIYVKSFFVCPGARNQSKHAHPPLRLE